MKKKLLSAVIASLVTVLFAHPVVHAIGSLLTVAVANLTFGQGLDMTLLAYVFVSTILGILIKDELEKRFIKR